MRLQTLLAAALVALQGTLCIAATTTDMPECGLLCTAQLVPDSACSSTNQTCICNDAALNAQLSFCVSQSCSTRDALTTKRFSDVSCQRPHEDNSLQIIVTTPLFGALALVFFALRVLSRYCTGFKATWGLDDWVMVPIMMASIPMTVLSFILSKHGLGKDMWMVDFDDIEAILFLYYWDEILYLFVVPATKISIICFYLRIFPQEQLRFWSYGLIAANILYFLAFEIITFFQCTPIEGAWLKWDGEFETTCRDVNLQAWVAAAVCIVLDVATIALPMPELWKLNLSWKKKAQVMLMFAVGLFVTIVSILRLHSLLHFAKTKNVTQDFVLVGVWSTVESSVGIMCACMPAIRGLFGLMAPKFFGKTQRSDATWESQNTPKLSWTRRHHRGRSEIVVTTKHVDDSSVVELSPFQSDEEQHRATTPKSSV